MSLSGPPTDFEATLNFRGSSAPAGILRRTVAEHRPAVPKPADGLQGRQVSIKADGGRYVEGWNPRAVHVSFTDSLRGGVFKEHQFGWRKAAKKMRKGTEVEFQEGLKEGMNFEKADQEFRDSLRRPSLPAGPAHWRRSLTRAQSSSFGSAADVRNVMSMSAPAGLFPPQPRQDQAVREELRSRLRIKYGSVLAGWRALDPLGHGKLSFNDFCKGVHVLGNIQDVKSLWEAMGKEKSGFVGVQDIDPELARLLKDFKQLLIEKCGTAEAAWHDYFCPTFGHGTGGKGRCAARTFAQAAHELGYDGPAEAVFKALNIDKTPGGISHKDFLLLDKWFHSRCGKALTATARLKQGDGSLERIASGASLMAGFKASVSRYGSKEKGSFEANASKTW